MRRPVCLRAALVAVALVAFALVVPAARAQDLSPEGYLRWSKTSRTGHTVVGAFQGAALGMGGTLGGGLVCAGAGLVAFVSGRDVGRPGRVLCVGAVVAGGVAGTAAGLYLTPVGRYRGSIVGGTVTGAAALAGGAVLFARLPDGLTDDAQTSEAASTLLGAGLLAIGMAGTAVGYRFGPGGRWHDVEATPVTGAGGSVGVRVAARF